MRRQPRRCSLCSPMANYIDSGLRGKGPLRKYDQVALCFSVKSYPSQVLLTLWITPCTTRKCGVSSGYADDAQKIGR
jgi:hypothetical protein